MEELTSFAGVLTIGVAGTGAILSGLRVITSTNPVHAIFALVLAFGFSTILLIADGAEFLGILFTIVYVGAIAILFLFVVMMLNIRLVELLDNATRYVPIGFILGVTLLAELVLVYDKEQFKLGLAGVSGQKSQWVSSMEVGYMLESGVSSLELSLRGNLKALGEYLYNQGWDLFMVAGVILLIAMIGAIVLTLHHGKDIQRQDIYGQIIAKVAQ